MEESGSTIDEYFDWSNLPEDLKVGILCGLGDDDDDKALMRLKSVSKSWYFLISNVCAPRIYSSNSRFCGLYFIRLHSDTYTFRLAFRGVKEHRSQLFGTSFSTKQHPTLAAFMDSLLPFKNIPPNIIYLQDCCNGLLLLVRFPEYCLLNPTTYECMQIPDNPQTTFNSEIARSCASALVFDPVNHDPFNSFLIVVTKAKPFVRNSSIDLDVFSSNSGNWASHTIPIDPTLNGFHLIDRSFYLNGNLYMLSMANYLLTIHDLKKYNNNHHHHHQKEELYARAVELPALDTFGYCGTFGVLRGTLAYSNSNHSEILVWVLLQDGLRWAVQHRISLDELILQTHAYSKALRLHVHRARIKVYAFHPNLEHIFVGTPDSLQEYNPRTKELELYEHVHLVDQTIFRGAYMVFPYSRCPIILKCVINNNK